MSNTTAKPKTLREFFKTHKWCKGAFAVNAEGTEVDARSDSAVAWCADGALMRMYHNSEYPEKYQTLCAVTHRMFGYGVIGTNENLGIVAILRAADKAGI